MHCLLRLLIPDGDMWSHMLEPAQMSSSQKTILKGPALQLGLIRLADLLVGELAARKSHLSAVSATQVPANEMWTKLNLSINGIISWLMCHPLEQNTRSNQGQTFECWPCVNITWLRDTVNPDFHQNELKKIELPSVSVVFSLCTFITCVELSPVLNTKWCCIPCYLCPFLVSLFQKRKIMWNMFFPGLLLAVWVHVGLHPLR